MKPTLKNNFEGFSYVVLSTDNQIVNFLPLTLFDFKEHYFVTIENSKQNKKWDKNLNTVTKEVGINEFLEIQIPKSYEAESIRNKIEQIPDIKNKKVVWNLTGGQRALVIAISSFLQNRNNDVVIYFEGNSEQLFVYNNKGERYENDPETKAEDIDITNWINLQQSLKLKGFDFYTKDETKQKLSQDKKNNNERIDFYFKLFSLYYENDNVRKILREMNGTDKAIIKNKIEETKKEQAFNKINNFSKYIDEIYEDYSVNIFGQIFERIVYAYIVKYNEENSNRLGIISHSVKIDYIKYDGQEKSENNPTGKCLDEFDIAILTKTGKHIILELKSGGTEPDVMKSHHYSTYATSGMYGEPILISPLLEKEYKEYHEKVKVKKAETSMEKRVDAVNHAIRADVTVWFIDTIEKELGELLK